MNRDDLIDAFVDLLAERVAAKLREQASTSDDDREIAETLAKYGYAIDESEAP